MTDPDPRIDYLNTLAEANEAVTLLMVGVDLILQGGTNGMTEVANEQPETIIGVIEMMADLIRQQQTEIVRHVEARMAMLDRIDKIVPPQ